MRSLHMNKLNTCCAHALTVRVEAGTLIHFLFFCLQTVSGVIAVGTSHGLALVFGESKFDFHLYVHGNVFFKISLTVEQ